MKEITQEYDEFIEKLNMILPIKAYPTKELIQIMKSKRIVADSTTELTISKLFNSGDLGGILCEIFWISENEVIMCGLTHLIFKRETPLYNELIEYQKRRVKRVKKLNR